MTATATRTQPSVDEAVAAAEAAVLARDAEERELAGRYQPAEERLAEQRVTRHLINGGDPAGLFEVPEEAAFETFDESDYEPAAPPQESPDAPPATIEREFLIAPELERIGKMLIRKLDEFETIRSTVTIAWYWKRQGGQEYGLDKLGGCKRITGLEREKVGADFLIHLAADHLSKRIVTNEEIERLLHHQLMHVSIHWKTKKPRYRNHDFAGFWQSERRYGSITDELLRRSNMPRQSSLFESNGSSQEDVPGTEAQ